MFEAVQCTAKVQDVRDNEDQKLNKVNKLSRQQAPLQEKES